MSWGWSPEQLSALEAFLAARGLCDGPLSARPIGDGHSNLTFLVSDGTRRIVVRRPPPPPVPPGGHDMLREARLIGALSGTDVPVPKVLAVAQAGEVLDVPLYVMTHVDGIVATDSTPERLSTAHGRRDLAVALIDTLAALHTVDWRARGLGDFGRPEGFNERHLRRMAGLVADAQGNTPEAFAELAAWLSAEVPAEAGASIVHNDYRLGNVMIGTEPPARILAVLDWELATIGDPLLDVGYFLASYPVAGEPLTPTQELGAALLEPGYPSREELATRYADATGLDLSNLSWYVAMSLWKLAVLYEYGRRRAATGKGDDYYADPALVERFLAAAQRAAGPAASVSGSANERSFRS
jgi:aminoglycoside phosphotransferase (APT) family kinase protein